MDERKRHVILTAQKLYTQKGFNATSIQDIIDASAISKGTFYNYFSSKTEFLIAIIEFVQEELMVQRNKLQKGKPLTDKKVFADQLIMRMQLNITYNLIPIFEAAHHSNDKTLKKYMKRKHLAELSWIASRLIDIYGKTATAFAMDGAIMMLGIIQHMIFYWKVNVKEELNIQELVPFTIRRMDGIIMDMMKTGDSFMGIEMNQEINASHLPTKEQIISELTQFSYNLDKLHDDEALKSVTFLMDELQKDEPRIFLLKPVIQSIRSTFINTSHAATANKLYTALLGFTATISYRETTKSNI